MKQTGLMVIAALTALILASPGAGVSGGRESQKGQYLAPAFELGDVNGRHFAWSPDDSADSRPLILWFTNLCAGCQSVMPMLESLYRDSLRQKVELVAVSLLGIDSTTVRNVTQRLGVTFPILLDPGGRVSAAFTGSYIEGTCPMENLFLVMPDGRFGFKGHLPGMSERQLLDLINN